MGSVRTTSAIPRKDAITPLCSRDIEITHDFVMQVGIGMIISCTFENESGVLAIALIIRTSDTSSLV